MSSCVAVYFCHHSAQTVYADVRVWVHANGSKEVASANTTLLK